MKVAREEVGWLAKAQWGDQEPMLKARVSYEFLIKDRRKHDIDNLASEMKPALDGIIDAGVVLTDDIEHLEFGLIRAVYDTRDETIITVKEII